MFNIIVLEFWAYKSLVKQAPDGWLSTITINQLYYSLGLDSM